MYAAHTPQAAQPLWRQPNMPAEESPPTAPAVEAERPLSREELAEWQRALERKESNLEKWERDLQTEQRHLRLVGSS